MSQDKRILVVNLGTITSSQLYFCAMDEHRIMFFYTLNHLWGIPEMNDEQPSRIEILRNEEIFDSATYFWKGHHDSGFVCEGFHYLRLKLKDKDQVIESYDTLTSWWLKENDTIRIVKEKWREPSKWLSQISSFRQYGASFAEVFLWDLKFTEKLCTFFGCSLEELITKKIIFSNRPDREKLQKFF